MTAIIQAPAASGGGGAAPDARNLHGSTTGLAPTATTTLITSVVGTRKLRGFNVHGTTDGKAWVEVDGTPLPGITARFNRALPAYIVLPNPEPYSSPSAVVTLRVTNEGPVSGDYDGILLGE